MKTTSEKLVILLSGILLLSIVLFRQDLFQQSSVGIWLYRILSIISIGLLSYAFSTIFRLKWWFFLLIFVGFEVGFYFFVQRVVRKQHPLVRGFEMVKNYYRNTFNTIQYNDDCSVFDETLFYKLKKGESHCENLEYNPIYKVNSFGLRDDENSLENPEIIVVGDSYAMGMGVEQNESFAQILEKNIHKKVLNAGISSYGTIREAEILKQLDRDSCKLLVIQYCFNDLLENNYFYNRRDTTAKISAKDFPQSYESLCRINDFNTTYFPFKNTVDFLGLYREKLQNAVKSLIPKPKENPIQTTTPSDNLYALENEKHAKYFFKTIEKIREFYKGKILVVDLYDGGAEAQSPIIEQFSKVLVEKPYENVLLLDICPNLKKEDYYLIDGHLKASGHQKVAEQIQSKIAGLAL